MSGSPFPTGGVGAGGIVGSQGALQVTSDGRFLLAADAGSHQISVLAIASDGTLQPAPGSPVDSGGIEPISIAVHNDLVYVANEGNGTTGSNYTGTLSPTGVLTPLANSTGRTVDLALSDPVRRLAVRARQYRVQRSNRTPPVRRAAGSVRQDAVRRDAGLARVSAFAVHGGELTELDASPFALPSGATPFGMAITSTKRDQE